MVVESRRSPLVEAVVSEEVSRGSPRLSIQESGRRTSTSSSSSSSTTTTTTTMTGTRQAVKTDGQGVTFTAVPSILQSSTVAPPQPSRTVGPTWVADAGQALHRLGPGSVIRATHPMPGMVTKVMKVAPSAAGPSAPKSAIVVRRNSLPVKADPGVASPGVSKCSTPPVPGAAAASLPLGLLRSPAQGDHPPSLLSVRGGQRVVGVVKSESDADMSPRVASTTAAPPVSVTEDTLRRLQGLPMTAAPSVARTEDDRQRLLMQNLLRMVAEKQNGGQARLVNWPQAVPGTVPLPLPVVATTSSAEGRRRNSPTPCGPTASPPAAALRGANRVIPLPVPTSSVVTSPAVSDAGGLLSSSPLTTISQPSAAHSQPTRPLLVFRSSSSVDPGSAGGQLGSVELRHVTTDALLALQRSASNSVNPANQSRGPGHLHFQPHHPAAAARPATFTLPMKAEMVAPPVSNHVARDGVASQTVTYASDGDPDEPKDLSLKPKKRADGETAKVETDRQAAKKSGPQGLSLATKPETGAGAKGSAGKKRKSEAASFQDGSKPTHRKVARTESSEVALQTQEEATVQGQPRVARSAAAALGSPATGRRGGATADGGSSSSSSTHAEGAVISISESGVITSRSTLDTAGPALVVVEDVNSGGPRRDASPLLMSVLQRTAPATGDGPDAERGPPPARPPAALLVPHPRETTLKERAAAPPPLQALSARSAKSQVSVERSAPSSSRDVTAPPAGKPLVTPKHTQDTKAASSPGTSRSRSPLDSVRLREGGDKADGNGGPRRQRSSAQGEPAPSRLSRSACRGSNPREVDGKDQSLATG